MFKRVCPDLAYRLHISYFLSTKSSLHVQYVLGCSEQHHNILCSSLRFRPRTVYRLLLGRWTDNKQFLLVAFDSALRYLTSLMLDGHGLNDDLDDGRSHNLNLMILDEHLRNHEDLDEGNQSLANELGMGLGPNIVSFMVCKT